MKKKAVLLLEDGFFLEGFSLGKEGESLGEVVFNTSITGYQEILTDPSYKGQMVCMTYPLIGNYGVNPEDTESERVWVDGFIIKEKSRIVSNWRATSNLEDFLRENNVVGIEGVDTRSLVKHTREKGSLKGIISSVKFDVKKLKKKLAAFPSIVGQDMVQQVTSSRVYEWENLPLEIESEDISFEPLSGAVAVIDCGVKHSILKNLKTVFEKVIVFPADTQLEEILKEKPKAVLFSNGPGDPSPLTQVINLAGELIERSKKKEVKAAITGICLGHQILGLALGGKAEKLKFGHHGGNHPVKDLETGKIDITAQNHNFIIPAETIKDKDIVNTHINLYDRTPEGMRHKKLPLFSVQFHPEAGPGPFDARHIFGEFKKIAQGLQD